MSGWTDGQPETTSLIKDCSGDQWKSPTEQLFSACLFLFTSWLCQISTWIISWCGCWRQTAALFPEIHTIFSATGNLAKQLLRKSLNMSKISVRVDYDSYICWGILTNETFTVSTLKYVRLKVFLLMWPRSVGPGSLKSSSSTLKLPEWCHVGVVTNRSTFIIVLAAFIPSNALEELQNHPNQKDLTS